jgi:hypothetical protein
MEIITGFIPLLYFIGDVTEWGFDTDIVKQRMSNTAAIKNCGIQRDDGAKESAQMNKEEANMNKLLTTYGAQALRDTFWSLCKQDHPDTTMLRFLRARKWDVDAATAMLASTLKWRLDTGDLVAGNSGIIKWEYRLKSGENIRQIIGHRQCRKTLSRELNEIAVGASVDFVEKRTEEMLADGSWGHWSTCDDIGDKPTAFVDDELIYTAVEIIAPRSTHRPSQSTLIEDDQQQEQNYSIHTQAKNGFAPRLTNTHLQQADGNDYKSAATVPREAPVSSAYRNGMSVRNGGRAIAPSRSDKPTNYGSVRTSKRSRSFFHLFRKDIVT